MQVKHLENQSQPSFQMFDLSPMKAKTRFLKPSKHELETLHHSPQTAHLPTPKIVVLL